MHLQRIFLIKDNKLYWSEVYQPFSFQTTSNVVITKDYENLVVLIRWSDQLYMASSDEWYRLSGTDPSTWAVKRTFTDSGIINKHTLKKTAYGLIGLWNDGIYLFDGNWSKNLTEKKLGTQFFEDISNLNACYAEFDGKKYYFYYPPSSLVIDFSYFPDIRIFENDFVADAHYFYKATGTNYLGWNGYEYSERGSETIPTSFISGDRAFKAILKRKCLKYFYYDIDTNGKDVTISVYVDGILGQTLILNESSRVRKRSDQLKTLEGYMFHLEYSCDDSQNVKVYAPWALEADYVGE
jgi:hypothetical protein